MNCLSQDPWKTWLPEVHGWLDRVTIEKCAVPLVGAHHVIAFRLAKEVDKNTGKEAAAFEIDAPALPKAFRAKIMETAKVLRWKPSARSVLTSVVEGVPVTLVGMSDLRVSKPQVARQWGLDAVRALRESRADEVVLCRSGVMPEESVLDGFFAGLYKAPTFKKPAKDESKDGDKAKGSSRFPSRIGLSDTTLSKSDIADRVAYARAQAVVRMVQDAPANWLTPKRFAEISKDLGEKAGLKVRVMGRADLERMGMGSFLGVARGSDEEPQLIVMEMDTKSKERVALVGKGLTFDSGGICVKPAAGMGDMKYDMSGGAAVLGAMLYLAGTKPKAKVVGLIGATENMMSGRATRPGDILKAMNGKTIEVVNTDAEGRLVLADVLHYAITEYKPSMIVDAATLTGAVTYGLGRAGAGLVSNDQGAADFVLEVARDAGEPLWQLPLWPELEKDLRGEFADLVNSVKPSVRAGTITAGIFLKAFVGETPWAHLDIAGTADTCAATGYPSSGASAYGMRTMVEVCMRFDERSK